MASRDNTWVEVKDPILRGILQRLVARLDSIDVAGTAIPSRSITSSMIALGAIVTTLIADSAITLAKIADGIFTATAEARAKFANGFVNAALLATDAVTTVKIFNLAVTTAKIDDLAVTAGKLATDAVTQAKVADQAIGPTELTNALAALVQGAPTLTPGGSAAAPATIAVTCQLKDCDSTNVASQTMCRVWLSDTTTGGPTGTVADAFTCTTGNTLSTTLAGADLWVTSDATGALVFDVQRLAGAKTWYLRIAYQGTVYTSSAITFT